jgi:hypothetical protein
MGHIICLRAILALALRAPLTTDFAPAKWSLQLEISFRLQPEGTVKNSLNSDPID